MNSPLGKYSQVVAAVVAIGLITGYVIASLMGNDDAVRTLADPTFIAIGAVFATSAVTNGWKQVVAQQSAQSAAIHARLDSLGAPPANLPAPTGDVNG